MLSTVVACVLTYAVSRPSPTPTRPSCHITTVMLMFITTSWAEDATIAAVICYAAFYGGFGQMVAGVFEVRCVRVKPWSAVEAQESAESTACTLPVFS